ncbi:hypothetical protein, variant 4 [Aphanomyces astaci]|uniref:Uncharacterized protein n=1 Tax=Aphanomyces astaci TaxID=112090 RepID=W4GZL4_APHAT|nr:hypothetical protein, variant 3 [Aphanomyces astaci]XP_009826157.1 hypothetical protein, variant 4 [Aphanomyces astaci]ETV84464.1 hypothetical protein, variant 3 [Aphanomyces astaci]ETV84465.1 hypothetical protein, variant 4 [Aphanomyces astaci]|eukprot:XP_009826156.1 hypothetical protein, variant 3 [Aphanomyces astaci]
MYDTHEQSLKLRAKANLDLLHERSARTLQFIKSRHANPTVVSDVEKKRLLCKENIQALQAQLATPILSSVHRHPPVTRSALRSHSSSDRIPTKGNKHVQFATTADEHFMTVPDVKSTLETHLKARLLKARAPPATTQTKSQRETRFGSTLRRLSSKRHPQTQRTSSMSQTQSDVPSPSPPSEGAVSATRPRRLRRHPATSSAPDLPRRFAFLRPAPRKFVYFKSPLVALPGDKPNQINEATPVHSGVAIRRRRRRYPRRLENPVFMHPRYPPYSSLRHYTTEYHAQFRPPHRRPQRLLLN